MDLFSNNLPKDFWLIKVGKSDTANFLSDNSHGGEKGIIIFSSKKSAEDEAKSMNAIRGRMKMDAIYFVVKGKKEDIEGCSLLLQ